MKKFGLMIAAALAVAALSAPIASFAAPAKLEPYTKEQLADGAKQAPAAIQAANLPCDIVNAAKIAEGMMKNPENPKADELKAVSFEIACKGPSGFIFQSMAGLSPKIYDCVSLAETPTPCRLPENKDVKAMMAAVVAASGVTCTVNNERPLGGTKAGDRFYEVGCAEGNGYIIKSPPATSSQHPVATDCSRALGTNLECKFTTKEQITAALNSKVGALMKASGKTCQLTGAREVASDTKGTIYYEAACGAGAGYMVGAKDGVFVRTIDCANASSIAGGCTLTDATKAETAEAGTYSKLAAAGGYPCQVSKYRYIGVDTKSNSEVVELQCSNRPDGRIALFPTDNKGAAHFYDCISAGSIGESCKLSDPQTSLALYTEALASKGKSSCKVSNAKWVGVASDGTSFVETACSDGLPGWVVARTLTGTVSELLSCGQAKSVGVVCTLPGNAK